MRTLKAVFLEVNIETIFINFKGLSANSNSFSLVMIIPLRINYGVYPMIEQFLDKYDLIYYS